jgi:hypothetical protein
MATPAKDETLGELLRLSAALAANEEDFGHMSGLLAQFQGLVAQIQEAATQQAILTAAKQEATRRFQNLLKAGHEHGVLLRRAAQVRYGRSSEKLIELGMQPFRSRKFTRPVPEPLSAIALDA